MNIEQAANIEKIELPIEAIMKPFFLPIKLISFEAIIEPIAIPMMEIDIGKVAKDFIGLN